MEVLVVEVMAVQMGVIQMGTITIMVATSVAIRRPGTILHPIPTGMIIHGLDMKSRFRCPCSVIYISYYSFRSMWETFGCPSHPSSKAFVP